MKNESIKIIFSKKNLMSIGVFGILLGLLTYGSLDIFLYTAVGYSISVIVILIIITTLFEYFKNLIENKKSIKFGKTEYVNALKKIITITILLVTFLDFYIPLNTKTTDECIHYRKNIFTVSDTKEHQSNGNGLYSYGVCTPTSYGIYLF